MLKTESVLLTSSHRASLFYFRYVSHCLLVGVPASSPFNYACFLFSLDLSVEISCKLRTCYPLGRILFSLSLSFDKQQRLLCVSIKVIHLFIKVSAKESEKENEVQPRKTKEISHSPQP